MTADYAYYKDTYKGRLSREEFDRFSRRAAVCLEQLTFGRDLSAAGDRTKDALCALADELDRTDRGGAVQSETNDGVSVTYANGAPKSEGRRLYEAAAFYLGDTGLLYRGASPC